VIAIAGEEVDSMATESLEERSSSFSTPQKGDCPPRSEPDWKVLLTDTGWSSSKDNMEVSNSFSGADWHRHSVESISFVERQNLAYLNIPSIIGLGIHATAREALATAFASPVIEDVPSYRVKAPIETLPLEILGKSCSHAQ
jgi:hypothetical protein